MSNHNFRFALVGGAPHVFTPVLLQLLFKTLQRLEGTTYWIKQMLLPSSSCMQIIETPEAGAEGHFWESWAAVFSQAFLRPTGRASSEAADWVRTCSRAGDS